MATSQDNDAASGAADLPAHVLVVEDDAILALALEDVLTAAGVAQVTVCSSMTAALKALEEAGATAEALILDVHLSDRDDGWALAEIVSLLGPARPRIIFSTAAPETIPAGIAAMGPVLEKPYAPEQLIAALQEKPAGGLFARLRKRG